MIYFVVLLNPAEYNLSHKLSRLTCKKRSLRKNKEEEEVVVGRGGGEERRRKRRAEEIEIEDGREIRAGVGRGEVEDGV